MALQYPQDISRRQHPNGCYLQNCN